MTALFACQDMTEPTERADIRQPMEATELIENIDAAEPIEPIERMDPTEPMDRTDPVDPMLSTEPSDARDHREGTRRRLRMAGMLPQDPPRTVQPVQPVRQVCGHTVVQWPAMLPAALPDVEPVVRATWCLGTCDPSDVALWSERNPARGQCGATALVLNDLFGGDLLLAEVRYADGGRQGVHYWNRLPGGREVYWTREQFRDGEVVGVPQVVVRPAALPRRGAAQYLLLSAIVRRALAPGSGSGSG